MTNDDKKTEDIVFYEKKAEARELLAAFDKKLKKARLICIVLTAAALCALAGPMLDAYDSEQVALLALLAVGAAAFCAASFAVAGALLCRSFTVFFRWRSLKAKFKSAEERMDKMIERSSEKTAYAPDAYKAEAALYDISEKVIIFGEKNNIKN